MTTVPFDTRLIPPAPVLLVKVRAQPHDQPYLLPMIVDTGADSTVIPETLARQLGAVQAGHLAVSGVGLGTYEAPLYSLELDIAGVWRATKVVALGEEGILGRDVLNQLVLTLDGPALQLSIRR